MALIKIKRGFYGLHTEKGTQTKGPKDAPFEVDENEANRLVNLGIAEYIGNTPVATSEENANEEDASVNPPENETPTESENEGDKNNIPPENKDEDDSETLDDGENEEDSESDIPEYSIDSSISDLRAIFKAEGISFKVSMKKSEMVEILDKHFGVTDAPMLSAETPVV